MAGPAELGISDSNLTPFILTPCDAQEKGWWATTDAGIMNIAQEAEKPHTASSYVQDSAVAHCSNKRLDYSAMFNNNMSDVGSREGAQ